MERVREAVEGAKGKVGEKIFEKVMDMIDKIDLFDQLAEMVKSVVPLKAEITSKGKKALEINVHGFKDGQLWISVKRFKEEKPAEAPAEEPAEEEAEETHKEV